MDHPTSETVDVVRKVRHVRANARCEDTKGGSRLGWIRRYLGGSVGAGVCLVTVGKFEQLDEAQAVAEAVVDLEHVGRLPASESGDDGRFPGWSNPVEWRVQNLFAQVEELVFPPGFGQ
jgi:hypothetical protein